MEIPVEFPLDADGFIRRECPACTEQFKWHYGPTESRPPEAVDPPMYTCPLCGRPAGPDQWWTQEQIQYQQEVKNFYAGDIVNDAMQQAFRGSKSIKYTPGKNTAPAPTALHEPNDMIIVQPPCHPWEPVKLPQERADSGPLHCLVCGETYSA